MKKSKAETEQTRRRIVAAAADEVRRKGLADANMGEVMSAAGLTHGGFYRHFSNREQLFEEGLKQAMAASGKLMADRAAAGGISNAIDGYLSAQHRDEDVPRCGLVMVRPREFDRDAALDRAMQVFWAKGFAATSTEDLVAAMGIGRQSLYNAFGDKQALFARALERYLDCTTRDRLRRYETALPPKEAILQFFAEIIDHSINDRKRKGCFLVNSALRSRRIKVSWAP